MIIIDGRFGDKKYVVNNFLYKKIDKEKYLVTAEHGEWCILHKDELFLLLSHRVEEDPALFSILEERGFIITERNIKKINEYYLRRFCRPLTGPTLHIIAVTLRCNHRCIYCQQLPKNVKKKEYDMDIETAKDVVKFIFDASTSKYLTIEFQGGEPLLNWEVIEYIIESANQYAQKRKKYLYFNLVSNLSLFDDEIANKIKKYRVGLNTSLDGPKDVHDKQRKYKFGSSYEATINGIEIARRNGIKVFALPTFTRYSLAYYKEIVNEYLRQGIPSIRMRELNYAGYSKNIWKKIGYTADEFVQYWRKYIEYIFSLNRKGIKIEDQMLKTLLYRVVLRRDGYMCLGSPCGALFGQTAYNYNGDIYACDESRSMEFFRLGNVKDNSPEEIYFSQNSLALLDILLQCHSLCEVCIYKPFCGPCIVWGYGYKSHPCCSCSENLTCKIRREMFDFLFKSLLDEEKRRILLSWVNIYGR